jgi:xanthine dehydrogenase accessory factor
MRLFYEKFNELIAGKQPFVMVTLVDTIGSAPQEPGAKMLVTTAGLYFGTVGGGKVENRAIQEAQALLQERPQKPTRFVQWNLSTDIGMTCGGSVKYYFEAFHFNQWPIVIFGAGHVAQALIQLLLTLDCRIICIDPRSDWLAKLPENAQLEKIHAEDMPSQVKAIPPDAYVLLMTMGHSTDKPILLEILNHREFPYIGVIGSRAKAVRLRQDVSDAGLPEACQTLFHCPIGLDLGSSHPPEIAISVAAQLLQVRDKGRSQERNI